MGGLIIRASSALRRQLCAGSARMEQGLPEEDSAIAAEGTLLHSLDSDPSLSRKKLTPGQRDLLNTSARLTKEVFQRVGEQFGTSDMLPDVGGFEREMFLHRGIKCLFSGHCDALEYFARLRLLVLIEKKFGFLPVDPASANMQTRAYACMGAEIYDCDNVVVAITQPRQPRDQQLTLAVYDREQIKASREQLFSIWDECNKPDAPLVAGTEQCHYCLARTAGCPAFEAKVSEGLSIIPAPPLKGSGKLTVAARDTAITQRIAQASDDQLDQLHEAVTLVGYAKEPLFAEIRKRKAAGGMVNLSLGKESEVREIVDVRKAVDMLTAAGLDPEKVYAACKMSMGPIEELYRDAHGAETTTWKDAKDAVNTLLAGVMERHTKAPAILRNKAAKALEAGR